MSGLWLSIGLAMLAFMSWRAIPIWIDGNRRGVKRRLYWALVGIAAPARYWWGTRIETMPESERADLLARETAARRLTRADSLHCPLCGAEVTRAWALDSQGRPTVAPGPVQCSRCGFRLDACRHCARFLPGGQGAFNGDDVTFGRCSYYKATQPVEQVCSPEMARQLKARGYDQVRAPIPIVDSFVPPDSCTAFRPDRKRTQASGCRWPDARRVALLRMLASFPASKAAMADQLSDDEKWLL